MSHNPISSRSHAFYRLYVNLIFKNDKENIKEYSIPIQIVDLAGIYKPNPKDELSDLIVKENRYINKSSFFLNRCINFYLLPKKKNAQQSDFYKESKLTMIMIDFLIDNSNKSLVFHINGQNQLVDFKENQTLLDDIGIFGENKDKKKILEIDPIKNEVKKSIMKSEKNLNNFMGNLTNFRQDTQGEYLNKFMYFQ